MSLFLQGGTSRAHGYSAMSVKLCWCTYPFLRSRRLLVSPLRRVTLEKPQSNQSAFAPFVRCLAKARHALAPVLLRGPAAIGHPWPGAANPASLPGCPLRRTSTRPLEGALRSKAEGELTLGLMSGGNQKRMGFPVGAGLPAKNVRTTRLFRHPALSLTSIASKLAPTGEMRMCLDKYDQL